MKSTSKFHCHTKSLSLIYLSFPNINLKRFVKIFPNGGIQGGYCRMITSLIDFSLRAVGSTSRRPLSGL